MRRIESYRRSAFALLVLIAVSLAMPTYAQTFSVVYNLGSRSTDPANPTYSGIVVQGRDGNLYSTSSGGGAHEGGAVFEISPAGKLRVRYSFCAQTNCTDGYLPYGGLTLGLDGNFYGTSSNGGSQGYGNVFKMAPNGSLTVLYDFTNGNDGATPIAPPIQGTDGSLYGTAELGGRSHCGTLYRSQPLARSRYFTGLIAFTVATPWVH